MVTTLKSDDKYLRIFRIIIANHIDNSLRFHILSIWHKRICTRWPWPIVRVALHVILLAHLILLLVLLLLLIHDLESMVRKSQKMITTSKKIKACSDVCVRHQRKFHP